MQMHLHARRHRADARRSFVMALWLSALLGGLLGVPSPARAEDYGRVLSVQASVEVQQDPYAFRLYWPVDNTALEYVISRKSPTATNWTTLDTVIGERASSMYEYIDLTAQPGEVYEYRIRRKKIVTPTTFYGYAHLYAGSDVPLVEARGTVVLIVDNTMAVPLAAELARLQADLVADGWQVIRHDVARDATPASIRGLIIDDYEADPTHVNAVFLFGHIPIVKSGHFMIPPAEPKAPDERQKGAWPTDMYYGDIDGVWGDVLNTATPNNVAGDGLLDPYLPPLDADPSDGAIELAVGRVDLWDLPAFAPLTEEDLLRRYLDKDHEFRMKIKRFNARGFIADPNSGDIEGHALNGWASYSAFFTSSGITTGTWRTGLTAQSYLWALGSGTGGVTDYDNLEGVTSTAQLVTDNPQAAFTTLYGEVFGYWSTTNNLLRAPLGTTHTLTCAYAGRPNWFFHRMGLNETIGDSWRLTANNAQSSIYQLPGGVVGVHTTLMGDPTLRMWIVAPPFEPTASIAKGRGVKLSWDEPNEQNVVGYRVYRATAPEGPYTELHTGVLTATLFYDEDPLVDEAFYMIKTVKYEETASGSFYNTSQGVVLPFTAGPPTWIPDAHVRRSTESNYVGDDVYAPTLQQRMQSVPGGSKAQYYIRIESDGNRADTLRISSPAAPDDWTVKFIDTTQDNTDRTTEITTGAGWLTPRVGDVLILRLEVTPNRRLLAGTFLNQLVTVTSEGDNTKADVVSLKTTCLESLQPDVSIRVPSGSYKGVLTFNASARNQAVASEVTGTNTAIYYVQLTNEGNRTDIFKLTAPVAPSGWTINYFVGSAGTENITTAVTATGYTVTPLPSGESTIFRIETQPTTTVVGGSSCEILLTAKSTLNPVKVDTVKFTTTKVASPMVDLRLRRSTETTFIEPSAQQAVSTGVKAIYHIQLTNTGDITTDRFRVTGPASQSGWTIAYYTNFTLGENITAQVTNGGWVTPVMSQQQTQYLRIEMTPDETVRGQQALTATIRAVSEANTTKFDTVKAISSKTKISLQLVTSPAAKSGVNQLIRLTARPTGGGRAQYAFYYRVGSAAWTLLRGYADSPTCTWTPVALGTYSLQARVHEDGSPKTYDATCTLTHTVEQQPIRGVSLSIAPTSSAPVGSPVLLSATPICGAYVEYQFRVGFAGKWTTIRPYATAPIYTWTPDTPGAYIVRVYAKEVSSARSYDYYASMNYTVTAPPPAARLTGVMVSALPASPQPPGTAVTLLATPVGGINVEYLYRVQEATGWRTIQAYTTTRTVTWTPSVSRKYKVVVYAREVGSTASYTVARSLEYYVGDLVGP